MKLDTICESVNVKTERSGKTLKRECVMCGKKSENRKELFGIKEVR